MDRNKSCNRVSPTFNSIPGDVLPTIIDIIKGWSEILTTEDDWKEEREAGRR